MGENICNPSNGQRINPQKYRSSSYSSVPKKQKQKTNKADLFLTFSTVNSPCYKSDNAIPLPNNLQWLFISSTLESKWVVAYANLPILISNTPPTPTSIIIIMVTAVKDAVLSRCQVFC